MLSRANNRVFALFILSVLLIGFSFAATIPKAPTGCSTSNVVYQTLSEECATYLLNYYPASISLSKITSQDLMTKLSPVISTSPDKYAQDILDGRSLAISAKNLDGISYSIDGKVTIENSKDDKKTFDLKSFDKDSKFIIYEENGIRKLRVETNKLNSAALKGAGSFDLNLSGKDLLFEYPGKVVNLSLRSGSLRAVNGMLLLSKDSKVEVNGISVSNAGKNDLEIALGSSGVSNDFISFSEKDGIKKIDSKLESADSVCNLVFKNGRYVRLKTGATASFSDISFSDKSYEFAGTGKPMAIGEDIALYQKVLNALDVRDATGQLLVVDGKLGWKTDSAIRAFQEKYKLKADGVLGPETRAKMKELMGDYSLIGSSAGSVSTTSYSNGESIISIGKAEEVLVGVKGSTIVNGPSDSYSISPSAVKSSVNQLKSDYLAKVNNRESYKTFLESQNLDSDKKKALASVAYAESTFGKEILTVQYNPKTNLGELSAGIYNEPLSPSKFKEMYSDNPNAIVKGLAPGGKGVAYYRVSDLVANSAFMANMQERYNHYKNEINGGKDYDPFNVVDATQVMLNLANNPKIKDSVAQNPLLLAFYHQRGINAKPTQALLSASSSYTNGARYVSTCGWCG